MTTTMKTIITAVGEGFLLALLVLLVPFCETMDVIVLGNDIGEISLTEVVQVILLLTTAIIFWYRAWRATEARGFLILVAGFFSCMLIRELDFLFDKIDHGFWFWPATAIAVMSIFTALKYCQGTVCEPMAAFINTKPYFYIVFGLLVVIIFSRIFGSGNLFWQHVVADYTRIYKSLLQEGLELFGYIFITYGSCLILWDKKIFLNSERSPKFKAG